MNYPRAHQVGPNDPMFGQSLFAAHDAIMGAPLDAHEIAQVKAAKQNDNPMSALLQAAIGAGVGALVGIAVGSARHGRNAAVGALVGYGLGVAGRVATVWNVTSQIDAQRRAKWVQRQSEMLRAGQ